MGDRTCLDVAAAAVRALGEWRREDDQWISGRMVNAVEGCRAALDAIHPALADLTPDDVAALFEIALSHPGESVPVHAWEVLSR